MRLCGRGAERGRGKRGWDLRPRALRMGHAAFNLNAGAGRLVICGQGAQSEFAGVDHDATVYLYVVCRSVDWRSVAL